MTSHIAQVDYALKAYLKTVPFSFLTSEEMTQILAAFLGQLEFQLASPSTKREIQDWFQDVTTIWRPSGREIRDLVGNSSDRAMAQKRRLTLKDVIATYTAKTGLPDVWDFVTDNSSYTDEPQIDNSAAQSEVIENLVREFGVTCSIPDDGRLPLTFSKSFCLSLPPESALKLINRLSQHTKQLQHFGKFQIIDWGWPRALWRPQTGCIYQLRIQEESAYCNAETPQMRWEKAKFTFGLQRLLNLSVPEIGSGMPWRRLL